VRSLTSHNPIGPHGLLRDSFTFFLLLLGGMGWGGMEWICLAQDEDHWTALVNAAVNLQVP
jgi:hypothetical protein